GWCGRGVGPILKRSSLPGRQGPASSRVGEPSPAPGGRRHGTARIRAGRAGARWTPPPRTRPRARPMPAPATAAAAPVHATGAARADAATRTVDRPGPSTSPALAVEGVDMVFDTGTRALDAVDLTIRPGELVTV